MSAPDEHCDFCDLPKSQCVHGRPAPPPPPKKATKPSQPRKRPSPRPSPAPVKRPTLRWTPPEAFKPLILTVLQEAGGELDAEELFSALEVLAGDRLLPGDRESTPEGELRWRYAVRRARVALLDEGVMTRTRPGVWRLAVLERD
jgi:hypothetical protein